MPQLNEVHVDFCKKEKKKKRGRWGGVVTGHSGVSGYENADTSDDIPQPMSIDNNSFSATIRKEW